MIRIRERLTGVVRRGKQHRIRLRIHVIAHDMAHVVCAQDRRHTQATRQQRGQRGFATTGGTAQQDDQRMSPRFDGAGNGKIEDGALARVPKPLHRAHTHTRTHTEK